MRTSPLLGSTRPVAEAAQVGLISVAAVPFFDLAPSVPAVACVVFSSATGPQLTLLT
jgi:hypothetical protein